MRFVHVQILRFLAAAAVCLFHASETTAKYYPNFTSNVFVAHGYVGVDLFFVISGFIIYYTVCNKESSPAVFISRRLKRIVPMYWIFTLLLPILFIIAPSVFKSAPKMVDIISSLLYVSFINGSYPILYVGWSLEYEMFFYILIFSAMLVFKNDSIWKFVIISLSALAIIGASSNNSERLLILQPFGLEFIFGILVARYLQSSLVPAAWLTAPVVALVIITFLGTGDRIVFAGIVSAILVYAATRLNSNLAPRLLVQLGDASYSIYLTHLFVISSVCKITVRYIPSPILSICISFIFSIIAGWLVHIVLEKPISSYLSRTDHGRMTKTGMVS